MEAFQKQFFFSNLNKSQTYNYVVKKNVFTLLQPK